MSRLETFTTAGLLALYRDTLRELRDRGVIRTANAPAGDYAEYKVRCAFPGSELAPNSEKSWDIKAADGTRLQVKCRVIFDLRNRGQRQLSPFRSFGFDAAAIVLLDENYRLRRASLVPRETVETHAVHRSHVNGAVLFATDSLLGDPDATDITELLREASAGDAGSLELAPLRTAADGGASFGGGT